MNQVAKISAAAPTGGGPLVPQGLDQAMRFAEMMARGKMIPAHLQGSPGDCFMVVEQAIRWNMSPFAVGQCTSSIKGKLMFEGKLVQAAVENSGAIVGLMDYEYSGEGQTRKITVSATRRGETAPKTVEVLLKDAITENGIWKKQPDQQLAYHGARVWARRWTPGVILGVYAPEEFETAPPPYHPGPTLDGVAERVDAPTADKPRQKADALLARIAACENIDCLLGLTSDPKIKQGRDWMAQHRPELDIEIASAFGQRYEALRPAADESNMGEGGEP